MTSTQVIRPQVIRLSAAALADIDLSPAYEFVSWNPQHTYFFAPNEHYRLLAFLAREVSQGSSLGGTNADIIDIGSHIGQSAAALWVGARGAPTVTVRTFDYGTSRKSLPPSAMAFIARHGGMRVETTEDVLGALPADVLAKIRLIALDVEPHDGAFERSFLQTLIDRDYKGLVVVDETRLNEGMVNLYKWAPVKKLDVTHIAHWSGTAILVFDPDGTVDVKME
jgi:hypothetical protein